MIKTDIYYEKRPKASKVQTARPLNGRNTNVSVSVPTTTRTPIHVHEIFLNSCRKEYMTVEVVTSSGEIIEGIIDGYDRDTIVLHNDMTQLLIYKKNITYISPRNGKKLILPEGEMTEVKAFIANDNYICENR